jgi:hypothetical protein
MRHSCDADSGIAFVCCHEIFLRFAIVNVLSKERSADIRRRAAPLVANAALGPSVVVAPGIEEPARREPQFSDRRRFANPIPVWFVGPEPARF